MKTVMIYDLSNFFHSSYYVAQKEHPEDVEGFWRHIFVGMILKTKAKYNPDEIVVAIDSRNNWRKKEFEYYKARRILRKQDSGVDWESFNAICDKFIEELKQYFPFKCISVQDAEADDVIAILVENLRLDQIIIVSRDKDFNQLQRYPNVKQYCPITDAEIKCSNPHEYLALHLLKGDDGDDIPNLLSDTKVFVTAGKRQTPVTKKVVAAVLEQGLDKYVLDNGLMENFERNKKLIELSSDSIPEKIQTEVMYAYNTAKVKGDFDSMMGYLRKNKLQSVLNSI